MAYIEAREQLVQPGNKIKKMYRARIRIKGMPEVSETFPKKSQATAWARKMESKIRDERFFPQKANLERTFGDFIDRYIQNELPKKPKMHLKQKMQLLWWNSHLGLMSKKDKIVTLSEYVFPSIDGSKHAEFTTAWKNVIKSLRLNICFHTLRHTGASHLAMNGATLLEIAAILGHKTLAMVKRYSHISTSATAKVLDKMNRNILEESVYG